LAIVIWKIQSGNAAAAVFAERLGPPDCSVARPNGARAIDRLTRIDIDFSFVGMRLGRSSRSAIRHAAPHHIRF